MNSNSKIKDNKIIGGEFAIAPGILESAIKERDNSAICFTEAYYDSSTYLLSSGRAALYAALKAENVPHPVHVSVPDYLCESIIDAIEDSGSDYSFYHIEDDLYPNMDSLFDSVSDGKEAVILINYFGVLDLQNIIDKIKQKLPETIVILDDVQNYYGLGKEMGYDYAFTSLRKWFPVPDGGVLKLGHDNAGNEKNLLEAINSMQDDNGFVSYKLSGNLLKSFKQVISDDICLELIEKGEILLDKSYKCRISDISLQIFNAYIKEEQKIAKSKRLANAAHLSKGLSKLGIKHSYDSNKVQLFVPIFVEKPKRDRIRKRMFDNNIFCPIHWRNSAKSDALKSSNVLYDTELSLICDQRYDPVDMDRILEILSYECGDH